MKKLIALLVAGAMFSGMALLSRAGTITFDEFVSSPAEQDVESTPLYYDNPIKDEYAVLGVHFKSGPETPAEISSGFAAVGLPSLLYGGDIFKFIAANDNWPGSNFPVLPPETQFLGMDKVPGIDPTTGIVVEYDNFSTSLSFEYRRPGNSNSSYSEFNVVFFDTTQNNWRMNPVHIADPLVAYTNPDWHEWGDIPHGEGWMSFSIDSLPPFNLILFYAYDKKFAIDNLSFPLVLDFTHDGDVDGGDLVEFMRWFGSTLDEEDLSDFAAEFGNNDTI